MKGKKTKQVNHNIRNIKESNANTKNVNEKLKKALITASKELPSFQRQEA